jgi:hypothetical protein
VCDAQHIEEMANLLRINRDASPIGKRWAGTFTKRHPKLKTQHMLASSTLVECATAGHHEQHRKFYLSLNLSKTPTFLTCLDESCMQEAVQLMNVHMMSRAFFDSHLGTSILNQFAAIYSLPQSLSALI